MPAVVAAAHQAPPGAGGAIAIGQEHDPAMIGARNDGARVIGWGIDRDLLPALAVVGAEMETPIGRREHAPAAVIADGQTVNVLRVHSLLGLVRGDRCRRCARRCRARNAGPSKTRVDGIEDDLREARFVLLEQISTISRSSLAPGAAVIFRAVHRRELGAGQNYVRIVRRDAIAVILDLFVHRRRHMRQLLLRAIEAEQSAYWVPTSTILGSDGSLASAQM